MTSEPHNGDYCKSLRSRPCLERNNLNFGSVGMQWVQEKVAGLGDKSRRNMQKGSGIPIQPLIAELSRYRLLFWPAFRQLRPIL
jgi:hypothetical protein